MMEKNILSKDVPIRVKFKPGVRGHVGHPEKGEESC